MRRIVKAILILYNITVIYYSVLSPLYLSRQPISEIIVLYMALNEGFYIHMVTYMILVILWKLAGFNDNCSLIVAMLTGSLLEIVQLFLPDRYLSLNDIIANIIGAFLGYLFIRAIIYLDTSKGLTYRLLDLKKRFFFNKKLSIF